MNTKKNESTNEIKKIRNDDEITVYSPTEHDRIITTIKAYQTIYDQITGKQQNIDKQFNSDYELTFGHLDQLNIKIIQLYKQYHIISKNCSISILHENDDKEEFDSYENFSTYNTSNIHPVIAIIINYNFSMLCPENKNIANYMIKIQITPGNIPPESLRERFGMMHYFGPTIKINIQYTDYVVARTFIENISDWVKSIERQNNRKFLFWFQRKSQYIPLIIKNIGLILIFIIVYLNINSIIPMEGTSNHLLFKNSLILLAIFYSVYIVLGFLGNRIEYGIDILSNNSKNTIK